MKRLKLKRWIKVTIVVIIGGLGIILSIFDLKSLFVSAVKKEEKMKIEYDNIYKKWVVWLKDRSVFEEVFKSKTKRGCKEYIEKAKRKKQIKERM